MSIKLAISRNSLEGIEGFDAGQQILGDNQVALFLPIDGKLSVVDPTRGGSEVEVEVEIPEEPDDIDEKGNVVKGRLARVEKQKVFQPDEKIHAEEMARANASPLIALLDPGFVDPEEFGQPQALGRVRFATIPAPGTSSTYDKLKALGVTDEALRAGVELHNPASYPELEVEVIK